MSGYENRNYEIYRINNHDGKCFLHKLEVYPEIKIQLIENFDYDVIGDQLGFNPELEVALFFILNAVFINKTAMWLTLK